jgi:hypothetical protein
MRILLCMVSRRPDPRARGAPKRPRVENTDVLLRRLCCEHPTHVRLCWSSHDDRDGYCHAQHACPRAQHDAYEARLPTRRYRHGVGHLLLLHRVCNLPGACAAAYSLSVRRIDSLDELNCGCCGVGSTCDQAGLGGQWAPPAASASRSDRWHNGGESATTYDDDGPTAGQHVHAATAAADDGPSRRHGALSCHVLYPPPPRSTAHVGRAHASARAKLGTVSNLTTELLHNSSAR